MTGLDEALEQQPKPMASANKAGIEQISYYQTITFTKYLKLVLPVDGFVFWIRSDLLSDSALLNSASLNNVTANQPQSIVTAAETMTVKGSLHYSTDTRQEEDETYTVNHVVFAAESEVENLNTIAPNTLWLGSFDDIRFAFSSRSSFYEQAGLWHYTGDAVYADMETQIIDDPAAFNTMQVVSNSLPIWLSMNQTFSPIYLPFGNTIPMYPSFLSPDNIRPPFATVHIVPDTTTAIASTPFLDATLSHYQLTTEQVRITLWGVKNDGAQTFVDFVNQFSLSDDVLGIMNMPILRDEKRIQSELGTIAQKKVIEYQVSYYQESARNIARQLIKEAIPTYIFN